MWADQAINFLFFVLQAIAIVIAVVICVVCILAASAKGKVISKKGRLTIKSLNKSYQHNQELVAHEVLAKESFKKLHKQNKQNDKALHKKQSIHKNIFVIDFHGDIKASQTQALSEEVAAILQVAQKGDEVVVRIESPGGAVNGYGLASAQLQRIKEANIRLVAVIDQVAASGGYMMASVADKIIASPFAILGSIGVVAQLPNIHRLLTDKGVDVELHTAGKYKRTLTVLGENTDQGREKFKEELEVVHDLFKTHIMEHRPSLDIEKVATGEYWFGHTALSLNLVDQLKTSDDYLLEKYKAGGCQIFQIAYKVKKSKLASVYHSVMKTLIKVGP